MDVTAGNQGPVPQCQHLRQQSRRVQYRRQQVPLGRGGAVPSRHRLGEIRRDTHAQYDKIDVVTVNED